MTPGDIERAARHQVPVDDRHWWVVAIDPATIADRRSTWTVGPRHVPTRDDAPHSLPRLLARIETFLFGLPDAELSTRWRAWIEDPDVAALLEAVAA